MPLGTRGWLLETVTDVVKGYSPGEARQWVAAHGAGKSSHARTRRYLREALRASGLLYGTPAGVAPQGRGAEEALFFALVRTLCRVGLDLAVVAEAPPGPRAEQLLLVFATLAGRLDEAEDIHRRIERASRSWPLPEKAWRRVEDALEERSVSLSSDPYYGLLLHNGAVYADAFLFAQVAAAYFAKPGFPREAALRRVRFAAARKALLTRVLVGLTSAERRPGFPTRRAVLRQIDDLHLPDDLADATRAFARRAFEKGVDVRAVLRDVRSREMKRFVLEQTVLASLVDGRRSERELSWLKALAQALGVSSQELTAVELGVADFYARNREVVDVFNMSAGAERMGEELVEGLQSTVRKNYRRLLQELKETGELSVLLTRAARGQRLSPEQKKAMREQLIDIAKVIPALAIFTAPGGVLLLVALARVMRFDLLPSAFQQDPEEDDGEPPRADVLSLRGRRR